MSSFSKSSERKSAIYKNRIVNRHVKSFYKILGQLDGVANKLKELEIELTKDNINEHASKIIGRDIDSMEKFLLLGKLSQPEDVVNNYKQNDLQ